MLASTETINAVADALEGKQFQKLVIDPVMVATTGASLLPSSALRELRGRLFPRATIITPNVPEAFRLLADATTKVGMSAAVASDDDDDDGNKFNLVIEGVPDLEAAARMLHSMGPAWVLVKGGHTPFRKDLTLARTEAEREVVVDVLVGNGGEYCLRIETEWMENRNTHGTGCSLACEFSGIILLLFSSLLFLFFLFLSPSFSSSFSFLKGWVNTDLMIIAAIASNLANGMEIPEAVKAACRYVQAGIKTAPGFGKGNGPLNHFHSTYTLPFPP